MICPNCMKELPDDSKFCQYCGNTVSHRKPSTKSTGTRRRSRPILVTVITIVVLIGILAGAYYWTYSHAKNAALQGDYSKASQLLVVPSITKLHDPLLSSYISAGILYEDEKYKEAKAEFELLAASHYLDSAEKIAVLEKTIAYYDAVSVIESTEINDNMHLISYDTISAQAKEGFPLALEGLDNAKESLYRYAIKRYEGGAADRAYIIFGKIKDYKRSSDYRTLCTAKDYSALLRLIDFENAKEVIINNCPEAFLRGTWKTSDSKYDFTIDQENSCTYTLPSTYSAGSYYSFQDGVYFTYSKDDARTSIFVMAEIVDLEDPAITKQFQFQIRDKDTISVYCYADGNTYRLYRQ